MLSFFERLDKYMEFKGLNDNQMTIKADLANGILGKARKRGSLSQDNISKILHACEDLDANWWFSGKGQMLRAQVDEGKTAAEPAAHYKIKSEDKLRLIQEILSPENGEINNKIDDISTFLGKLYFKLNDLDKKVDSIKKLNDG